MRHRAIILMATATIALSACQTPNIGGLMSQAPSGYLDSSDACYAERQQLSQSETFFNDELIATSAIAGVIAFGTSMLAGASVGEAALIGAGSAVVAGVASGYWQNIRNQADNNLQLLETVETDLSNETDEIRRFEARLAALNQCRREEADAVRADLASGAITRSEAEQQMAAVRQRLQQDINYARTIAADIGARSDQLVYATGQIAPGGEAYLAPDTRVARTGCNVRASASTSSPVVSTLSPGQAVNLLSQDGSWTRVRLQNGQTGFVSSSLLVRPADYRPPRPATTTVALSPQEEARADEVFEVALGNQDARADVDQLIEDDMVASLESDDGFALGV